MGIRRDSSPAAARSRRRRSITDRVYPGLVWMALHFAQAKVNWLTHDVGDSLIGTPEYKVLGRAHRACLSSASRSSTWRSASPRSS